jgi:hypothetical protein
MEAITWEPGTRPDLDQLFDQLRVERYNDRSHRLWKNYGEDSFQDAVALTISFNDNNEPEVCSSISSRSCWPDTVYRIYHRTWKTAEKKQFLRTVTPAMGIAGTSQVRWLLDNRNCQLYFISRETENWQEWMIENFYKNHSLKFKMDNYRYLTCPNECDDTCWQHIIYQGDSRLLTKWKRK